MENYRNSNCMSRSGCQSGRGDMEARRASSRTSNTMAYMNNRQVNPSAAGNTASGRNTSNCRDTAPGRNTSNCRDTTSERNTSNCRDTMPCREHASNQRTASCQSSMPHMDSCTQSRPDMDRECISLCDLPLGMGYVPMQRSNKTYDTCLGFKMGTIFPVLCKPFCGKGGAHKC